MPLVVDTNVAVVSNGRSRQASPVCVLTCIEWLEQIKNGIHTLVLDDQFRIIREYLQNLRSSGQPGYGDAFLKWVFDNYRNVNRCELVTITSISEDLGHFAEFPNDPELGDFDPSDRKFIAVALAHPQHPAVLQAVDARWWQLRDALRRNGVRIEFICAQDISL